MHILIITDSYPPEIRSASHLMYECASELHARGHRVTVMTCWPQYNLNDTQADRPPAEFMNENGVEVIRIKTPRHHNVGYFYRGIAELTIPFIFRRKAKEYSLDKPDVVLIYSPPLSLSIFGSYFARRGSRVVLNVQDLFPQNAIDLGVLKNYFLIRFFRLLERYAYKHADVITTHSLGNQRYLREAYPLYRNKVVNLPNWVDLLHHHPKANKDFRAAYDIPAEKRVVVFAGVLGPSQQLDWFIHLAKVMRGDTSLLFLIVGDGAEKKNLQQKARKLPNVMFQHFVPRHEYSDLLAICDLGVVSLSEKNKTPVVPGKLLGYMAAKLPVFAVLNQESDAHALIEESGCGLSVKAGDQNKVYDAFQKMVAQADRWQQLGEAGYVYAEKHFSKETTMTKLEYLMEASSEA